MPVLEGLAVLCGVKVCKGHLIVPEVIRGGGETRGAYEASRKEGRACMGFWDRNNGSLEGLESPPGVGAYRSGLRGSGG